MVSTRQTELVRLGGEEYYVITKFDGTAWVSFELETQPASKNGDLEVSLKNELIVIDSIASGKGRSEQNDFYKIVMKPIFDKLDLKHKLIKTTSRDTISTYARSLAPSGSYTVMFLSGDTSISEFINNLPQGSGGSELSILPFALGSGNAWASSLGLTDPAETLARFLKGSLSPKHFPLYRAIFPNGYSILFFVILSLGFHANMLHACEEPKYKKMGNERFKEAGIFILMNYDLNLSITVGDNSQSYSYFGLISTPKLEPAYTPSPHSDPLKQELHVLGYSSDLTKEQLLGKIMKGYELRKGDDLPSNSGTTYQSLTSDFDVQLNFDEESSPRYKFELCCDGVLLNLLDLQSEKSFKNTIHIEFPCNCSAFNLKALSPNEVKS